MCCILVKNKGVDMPKRKYIEKMFQRNHDGIGFMINRLNKVLIVKGITSVDEYYEKITKLNVNKDDVLIVHFRWATQCKNTTMTQPFPFTDVSSDLKKSIVLTNLGICHNGIIQETSTGDINYSDTALFIKDYLFPLSTEEELINDTNIQQDILDFTQSKWAFLDQFGQIATIGKYVQHEGILYSNYGFL